MFGKKADVMKTFVTLVVVIVMLIMAITFITQSGIFSSVQSFFCPTLTRVGSYARGAPLDAMWNMYNKLTEESTAVSIEEWGFGKIEDRLISIQNNMGLITCMSPPVEMKYTEPCGPDKGVSNVSFMMEVSKRSIDCWDMYTAGQYDPLLGKTPPNPRTCFIIHFNLKQPVKFLGVSDYLSELYYKQNNGNLLPFEPMFEESGYNNAVYNVKKGILYIKYLDTDSTGFETAECNNLKWYFDDITPVVYGPDSGNTFKDPDKILWCLEEDLTYNENCNIIDWSAVSAGTVKNNIPAVKPECTSDPECDKGYFCEANKCVKTFTACSEGTPTETRCGDYCPENTACGEYEIKDAAATTIYDFSKQIRVTDCAAVGCTQLHTASGRCSTDGTEEGLHQYKANNCLAITDESSCTAAGCSFE